jgi:hypothetical protein
VPGAAFFAAALLVVACFSIYRPAARDREPAAAARAAEQPVEPHA